MGYTKVEAAAKYYKSILDTLEPFVLNYLECDLEAKDRNETTAMWDQMKKTTLLTLIYGISFFKTGEELSDHILSRFPKIVIDDSTKEYIKQLSVILHKVFNDTN